MSAPQPPEVSAAIERMHQISADLDRQAASYTIELRELREKFAKDDLERAKAARRGELGPEWKKLQQRIDLDQTSIGDLVTGADDSSEADLLRQRAAARGQQLYEEESARVADEGDPVIGETVALQGEIRELVREIAAMQRPGA